MCSTISVCVAKLYVRFVGFQNKLFCRLYLWKRGSQTLRLFVQFLALVLGNRQSSDFVEVQDIDNIMNSTLLYKEVCVGLIIAKFKIS